MLRLEPRGDESPFWRYLSPVLALAVTCVFSGVLFALIGKPPLRAIYTFLVLPLRQPDGIEYLLIKAAPLIMIGVGLALAYRAAVWNIGTEGQFTLGAIAAGGIALAFPDAPGWLIFPAMIAAGTVGGMAAAGLVAWLRISFNANEILTSLMLTYIIQYLLIYLVTGPWRDPAGFGFPQTAMFSDSASGSRLMTDSNLHLGIAMAPVVAKTDWCASLLRCCEQDRDLHLTPLRRDRLVTDRYGNLHLGIAIPAPVVAIALWVILQKSMLGYQAFRVLGQAPRALRFAGFGENRLVWIAMAISGGLAGLAGMFEVSGTIGQLTTSLSPGYGFAAIITAFLGRLNPIAIVPAGLLLALSYLGGDAAQMNLGLPNAVTAIFQGILLFCLLGCDVLLTHRIRWRVRVTA